MTHAKDDPATTQQGEAQSAAQSQPASTGQPGQRRGLSRREDFLPSSPWPESPFSFMRRFSEEMDKLFGDVFADFGTARRRLAPGVKHGLGSPQAQWAPPIEVLERNDRLVVRAELPGLSKDDVKVEVTDDLLTIAGERREEREETREGYRHSERRYGRFSRSVPLPEGVNSEDVRCTFQNRVLEITMPAPQRVERSRRIEIQGAPDGGGQPSAEQPKTDS
jgi:HSP20 family protein